MKYPEYVEIDGKRYRINTDFRVAIKCNQIAQDTTIGDYERCLAIIYTLFGDEGINAYDHYERLLELAKKYLLCGNDPTNEEPDMDYTEDYAYIKTSFRSDYGINLDEEKMHWWEFTDLMEGLSNSEMGNCCVLNRIRNLRNYDTSKIEDANEKQKIEEAKQRVALKKNKRVATQEQEDNATQFLKDLGLI